MKTKPLLLLTALALAGLSAFPPSPALVADSTARPASKKDSADRDRGPAKPYPLSTCIVTDNDLGSMGEETSMICQGQMIKFCCAPCERKFLKNPDTYLAKLAREAAKNSEN